MASLPISISLLRIYYASAITDDALVKLSERLPHLQALDLVRSLIKDSHIPLLPRNLSQLSLEGSFILTGDNQALSSLPPSLKSLRLSWCKALHSDALQLLPASLTFLDLSNCPQLTDVALSQLPASLKELDLTDCTHISAVGIARLPSNLQKLTINSYHGSSASFKFPMGLKTLCLSDSCRKALSNLPACLSSLYLTDMFILNTDLDILPAALTTLSVCNCWNFTTDGMYPPPLPYV